MQDTRYDINTFPYGMLKKWKSEKRKRGNQGTKRQLDYLHPLSAFDIETSRDDSIEQAWMYVWMWGFEGIGVILGRTWDELKTAMDKVKEQIGNKTLVILVHNLSYEFVFLRSIHEWKPEEVFAIRPRKVCRCYMGDSFEFRCTYLHSNMSLDVWTHKMGVQHTKLDGLEFDYDKVRYADTPLTEMEMQYCCNDVIGCMEAYRAEMDRDKDVLSTIPMTSTGYVRRDVKRAMHPLMRSLYGMTPSYSTYQVLREAFRGGLTHANRYYSNVILHDVNSADRSSSYPDVICNDQFPMGKFRKVRNCTYDKVMEIIATGHAVVFRAMVSNIRLKDKMDGFPYLSVSKCRGLRARHKDKETKQWVEANYVDDNGRVLSADYLETSITDVDMRIIGHQYEWDKMVIEEAWWTHYGPLPDPLRITVIDYYKAKTGLKGLEDKESKLMYDKSKALLNSIYGMMAQDPIRESLAWMDGEWQQAYFDKKANYGEGAWIKGDKDPETKLTEAQRNVYALYQWGVWTTALARLRLMQGVDQCKGKCVYVDTDSCKYLGEVDWSTYNKKRVTASKSSGAWAVDPAGEKHFMGVFEQEQGYKDFKTMGAKKYAFIHTGSDRVETTIAGVSKRLGGQELQANGGLEAFREGFVFSLAGGTESIYNDKTPISKIKLRGHDVEMGPNICITPSTYRVGLTGDYRRILEEISLYGGLTGPGGIVYN